MIDCKWCLGYVYNFYRGIGVKREVYSELRTRIEDMDVNDIPIAASICLDSENIDESFMYSLQDALIVDEYGKHWLLM